MNFSLFLQTCSVLSPFRQADLDTLERAMSISHYPDGHVFIREGERGDAMYLVIDGQVDVVRRRAGGSGIDFIHSMVAGEMFGLLALVDQYPRAATCTAVGPVQAASLSRDVFQLLCHTSAPISLRFQESVAQQMMHDFRTLHEALIKRLAGQDAKADALLQSMSHEYRVPGLLRAPAYSI